MFAYFLPKMPKELSGLSDLARDMRWSWSHTADEIWQMLDADLWESTRNPWILLQAASADKLRSLASDPAFRNLLRDQVLEHEEALACRCWFDDSGLNNDLHRVAYFSMEFGLSESLPLYSGGLGILAGDLLKTASDLGVPVVGVGLLYQQGYFRQVLDAEGRQRELFPYNDPVQLPVFPVRKDGDWMRVSIALPGRRLRLQLWEAIVGRVRLLLLDSNDPLNTPADRGITAELYGGSLETRLQQEMVLGIGGTRALGALRLHPEVFHMNEGHCALAALERARTFSAEHACSIDTALTATRAGNLFTTHTPVAAGFDRFPPSLVRQYLSGYSAELEIDMRALLALGRVNADDDDEPFNMTYLALHSSGAVNAVSRLHREVSEKLFAPLFPRWPLGEVPVGSVTNGVHVPSWDSAASDALWTRTCGRARWRGVLDALAETIQDAPDEDFWRLRNESRSRLVAFVRHRLSAQLARVGADDASVDAAATVLDPNVLTLCFARRFVEYKRPHLLLQDSERLVRLLTRHEQPVQIVLAGKAHPADTDGKELVHAWTQFIETHGMQNSVVFLIDHDMVVAEHLAQGADVWLNTPRRPWEASGTSGMKVLVNGGLNLSSLDGWWAEAFRDEVGWAVGDGGEHDRSHDSADASELYRKLESDVVPLFYRRDERGIPTEWVAKIRVSLAELTPRFSSNRMLREYVETYYAPLARGFRARTQDDARLALEIEDWRRAIREHWSRVRIDDVHLEHDEAHGGHQARALVQLGELAPDAVAVELYAESDDSLEPQRIELERSRVATETAGSFWYETVFETNRPLGDYTLRVVPHHRVASTPLECHALLWRS